MTKTLLYETYLKESGEIITLEEWLLYESKSKLKKMESYWNALKRYGIIGLTSYITGGEESVIDSVSGGSLPIPLSLILYAGYRKNVNVCIKQCNTDLCDYKCYIGSCGEVIKQIYKSKNIIRSKSGNHSKAIKKLDKEMMKWVKRYNKYKTKINQIEKQKAVDNEQLKKKEISARARYYGGSIK